LEVFEGTYMHASAHPGLTPLHVAVFFPVDLVELFLSKGRNSGVDLLSVLTHSEGYLMPPLLCVSYRRSVL